MTTENVDEKMGQIKPAVTGNRSRRIFGLGALLSLLILPQKSGLRACSVKTALARGLAYAHHGETADPQHL
jgi:hypothetical protein